VSFFAIPDALRLDNPKLMTWRELQQQGRSVSKEQQALACLGTQAERHEDIWLVSFMDCDLGYFDLVTRVLEQDSCHFSLNAQVSGFAVDGEYLRQRRSADKDRNRLAAEFRLKTNGLHRKIWNE
jgi:hypothetical protein